MFNKHGKIGKGVISLLVCDAGVKCVVVYFKVGYKNGMYCEWNYLIEWETLIVAYCKLI